MWKYAVIAVGTFTTVAGAVGLSDAMNEQRSGRVRATSVSLDEQLAQVVERDNQRIGEETHETIFEGARLNGYTVVFSFTMKKTPYRFDQAATSERLQQRMKRQFCRGAFASLMRQGATVVYRYRSKTGRDLVDAKVNAAICKLTV